MVELIPFFFCFILLFLYLFIYLSSLEHVRNCVHTFASSAAAADIVIIFHAHLRTHTEQYRRLTHMFRLHVILANVSHQIIRNELFVSTN